jgi:putative acetyltransferase
VRASTESVESEVLIRRAIDDDAIAVREVVERAIRESAAALYSARQIDAWEGGGSRSGVAAMIGGTVAFVAELRGRVVGFANLDGSDVDQMYVDPGFEGRGFARRLYEAVEWEARSRSLDCVTATASLRAVDAFTRFGFNEVRRTERSFNGESFAVVEMNKDLTVDA